MLRSKEYYIKELKKYSEEDDVIYLLEKFCDDAGLFARNQKFLYLVKCKDKQITSLKTEYLNMFSNVSVSPVSNEANFPAGNYNIIEFNGNIYDVTLNSYLELCYLHSQNVGHVKFADFFNSLVEMFQIPHEQQYKNLLGFYGEILFLIKCNALGVNLIDNWHKGEQNDCKYDLVFNNCNADIKTIISQELIVTLKHNQIFNRDKNYLILMRLEKNNSGKSLRELLNNLKDCENIKYNLDFWLKVEKEKFRISKRDFENEKFSYKDCFVYECSAINPFPNIPLEISNLKYNMDLLDEDFYSLTKFLTSIS